HPSVKNIWHRDIRDVSGKEILKAIGMSRGQLDLLAGCPPCQGFSSMTTLNGNRTISDPRNDLVGEYARLVEELNPRAIILENVPGLKRDLRFDRLIRKLRKLGYSVDDSVQILDAANFGIPQHRRRLVLICSREGVVAFDEVNQRRVTVWDAIGNL